MGILFIPFDSSRCILFYHSYEQINESNVIFTYTIFNLVQVLPSTYWRKSREAYNQLSSLTQDMDDFLSPLILLSFAHNLYFICLQLLNSLKYVKKYYVFINFYYNITFLQTYAQRLGGSLFFVLIYVSGWKNMRRVFICRRDKRPK